MSICAPLVRRLIRRRRRPRGEPGNASDGPQRAGRQGLRTGAAQGVVAASGGAFSWRTRIAERIAFIRRNETIPESFQSVAPGKEGRRSGEGGRERGTPPGLRPRLHAPSPERGGEMEARGPGVPSGSGPSADNVVQAGRQLLRRGRQPPRLRRPLPRSRVDRRRRHGASARGRARPTSASRSRAGIAGRMIQARSPAGQSADPGLAAALPSTREAREPTREPAKAAKEPSTDGGYGPLLGDED